MGNNRIVAVKEILPRCLNSRFQSRDNLRVLRFAIRDSFILKNHKESAGNCFSRANCLDKAIVVQLQFSALWITLGLHIPLDGIEVLSDISLLCQHFDLDFYWGNLHPAREAGNDILLLRCTA